MPRVPLEIIACELSLPATKPGGLVRFARWLSRVLGRRT